MTMQIDTVIYHSKNPISPSREYLAFIVVEAHEMDGKKRTGNMVKDQLSVVFYGRTGEEAWDRAQKFWAEETAKAKARAAHAKALGESRRKK
jgi:hypothetical protein